MSQPSPLRTENHAAVKGKVAGSQVKIWICSLRPANLGTVPWL